MIQFSNTSNLVYAWPTLTLGNFNKYPNEHANHVLSVDVISRTIEPSGELVTVRLLQMKQPIPSIFQKLGLPFPEKSYFLERSVLNKKTQVYEATSYSLNMRDFFQAEEVCRYHADQTNGGTLFTQTAKFTAFSYFANMIEEIAINRFKANASKGIKGLEASMEKIKVEFGETLNELEQKFEKMGMEIEKAGLEAKETINELDKELFKVNRYKLSYHKHLQRLFSLENSRQYNPFFMF